VPNFYWTLNFSSQAVAKNLALLQSHGITHIVNVATNVPCLFPDQITYLALTAVVDEPTELLKRHFEEATEFMRKAVQQQEGRGKVG
jgi:hypothetical protein